MLYFQSHWFYFILILLGNVLVDVIFINNTLFIFLLNLLKSFAILIRANVTTCNNMHLYAFILKGVFFYSFAILISSKCSSHAFLCIFILFLIKSFHLYFIYFNFHPEVFIFIHIKRDLFIKKFLLTLNLGI